MESNGSCVSNAPGGFIPCARILTPGKTPMHSSNASSAKKYKPYPMAGETYPERATRKCKRRKIHNFSTVLASNGN